MAYVGYVDSPAAQKHETIFVSRSTDDGVTWGPFVPVATVGTLDACCYPNIRARLGIIEDFAVADPSGTPVRDLGELGREDFDVMFSQSTDGSLTWSAPVRVNDPDPTTSSSLGRRPGRARGGGGVLRSPPSLPDG